jgi:hypothetical protein
MTYKDNFCPVVCRFFLVSSGFEMSFYQQRLISAATTRPEGLIHGFVDLNLDLSELIRLRERVSQAQLSAGTAGDGPSAR